MLVPSIEFECLKSDLQEHLIEGTEQHLSNQKHNKIWFALENYIHR